MLPSSYQTPAGFRQAGHTRQYQKDPTGSVRPRFHDYHARPRAWGSSSSLYIKVCPNATHGRMDSHRSDSHRHASIPSPHSQHAYRQHLSVSDYRLHDSVYRLAPETAFMPLLSSIRMLADATVYSETLPSRFHTPQPAPQEYAIPIPLCRSLSLFLTPSKDQAALLLMPSYLTLGAKIPGPESPNAGKRPHLPHGRPGFLVGDCRPEAQSPWGREQGFFICNLYLHEPRTKQLANVSEIASNIHE